ncbi:MAG: hypothetical protein ACKO5E_19510, partial [bacterium]
MSTQAKQEKIWNRYSGSLICYFNWLGILACFFSVILRFAGNQPQVLRWPSWLVVAVLLVA